MSKARTQQAQTNLTTALTRLADTGKQLPCAGDPRVISEERHEREQAAQIICPGCPVKRECFEAGTYEQFGIWGGRDRTPRPKEGTRR